MSNIKMSEEFYLPLTNKHGVVEDDSGLFVADLSSKEMDFAMCYAINNHDKLTSRVAELEAALTKQKRTLDGAMSQLSRPCNSINDLSFIAFVGVVEKETNDLLKESE